MFETVDQLLLHYFSSDPDQVCLTLLQTGQEDRPVTYRELEECSARYALAYAQAGVRPGEVVILILSYGLDLIGAFWGAVLHGAIPSIMPFLTEKLLPDRYRKDLAALFRVTVSQLGAQRHQLAVDLRRDAAVADVGVNRIGEVHGRGAA